MFLAIVTKERLTQALSSLWQKILELLPNIVYNKELNSFIIGGKSKVQGANAVAMGLNCEANGKQSVAIGTGTKAAGNHSFASGYQTQANNPYDHVEGFKSIAQGKASHAEGSETIASGVASHAEGAKYESNRNTESAGQASHAEGASTYAKADGSHAEGILNIAGRFSNEISTAAQELGISGTPQELAAKLLGYGAHAEGMNNKALGSCSHSEGNATKALANSTHAEGDTTIASGEASHAEGYNTQAKGNQSHAEGSSTIATGNSAHAEGFSTVASGSFSHAEGSHTEAIGRDSHAEGAYNKAIGIASHVEGEHNIAKNQAQHVSGKYATIDESGTAIFQVGIGESDAERKDALRVTDDGRIFFRKEDEEVLLQEQLDSLHNSLGKKADKSNLNRLEQEINTFETTTGRAIESLNNSVKTLNNDVGTLQNDVGTLQEQQAGNDQEIANLQSELSSRVTKKQLDDALSDLSGSVGGGTSNVINDVSLFAWRNSSNTDYTMLKAPQGLIKETDKVIFARYIKNKTRPRVNGRTDPTKSRRVYKGWIRPRIGSVHEQYPLWMSDTRFVLSFNGTFDGYDYFYIEDNGGDDIVTILYDNSKAIQGKIYPKVVDKKLGIKIVRDGKTIVDYLPFTIKCTGNVPYFSRI